MNRCRHAGKQNHGRTICIYRRISRCGDKIGRFVAHSAIPVVGRATRGRESATAKTANHLTKSGETAVFVRD